MEKIMYGFVYAVQEDFVLVRPFFEEELVEISGTDEQIEDIRIALGERDAEKDGAIVVVTYDMENRVIKNEEKRIFYGSLAE